MTLICVGWPSAGSPLADGSLVIVNLEQQTATIRLERTVHRAGRAARIGARRKALAALPIRVVADRQITLDEIHLLPIIMHEGLGCVDAGLEAQQPCAAAVLLRLVERTGEDLLLDAGGIARRRLPAAAHVEPVEFEMRLVDGHRCVLLA